MNKPPVNRLIVLKEKVEELRRYEALLQGNIPMDKKGWKAIMKEVNYNTGQFTKSDGRWIRRKEVLNLIEELLEI